MALFVIKYSLLYVYDGLDMGQMKKFKPCDNEDKLYNAYCDVFLNGKEILSNLDSKEKFIELLEQRLANQRLTTTCLQEISPSLNCFVEGSSYQCVVTEEGG